MKALKLLVVGILVLFAGSAKAQISVNVNLGTPPQWGPSGYSDVQYYYLPDVEAYYDVPSSMFIYNNGVTWVHRRTLPTQYRNYDLYNGYKVVMNDYRGNTPYTHFRDHKKLYAKGYRGPEQHNIGKKPERGNYDGRNYSKDPSHQKSYHKNDQGDKGGKKYQGNSHDRGKGNGKGNGKKNKN